MELRKFRKMVEGAGYLIERSTNHWHIVDQKGQELMSFATTHGRYTKRDEVKPFYINKFQKALTQGNHDE